MKSKPTGARTSTITPANLSSTLTSFSPNSSFYAHLLRAPDAHTLRIFESSTGKCVSRWASNAGADANDDLRVGAIEWTTIPAPTSVNVDTAAAVAGDASGKRGKKRRKSDPEAPVQEQSIAKATSQAKVVLALGLEDGSIRLRAPQDEGAAVVLSHPTSTSPITALSSPLGPDSHLWSAHADGSVRVWDIAAKTLAGKVAGLVPEATRWDDLAVRYLPSSSGETKKQIVQLLLTHLAVHVFSLSIGTPKKDKVRELKATEIGRAVGHVDKCFACWTGKSASVSSGADAAMVADDEDEDASALTFLSYSHSDRFTHIWSLTLTPSTRADAALTARLALDSGVQSIAFGQSALDDEEQILAAIDVEGKVSLARLPHEIPVIKSTPGKKGKSGIATLEVESEVVGAGGAGAGVVKVAFESGTLLKVSRSLVKPTFEVVAFVDEEGAWVPTIELEKSAAGLLNGAPAEGNPTLPQRYTEPGSSSVRSGDALPDHGSDDEELVNTGELDVDMAEPTLAERLKALNVTKASRSKGELDFDVDAADQDDEDEDELVAASGPSVPATTLTTTLIQALHSSDAPLLESCLSHNSPPLIRATVKRLPSGSLILGLLEALVERLGKGKKGAAGAASVARARGLIEWVKQVLIVHVGFLVTIPSLVNRLAALHASLTSRLALQPTLLALDGRLELVMSQIELRQERAAARTTVSDAGAVQSGSKYVEGESDDSGSEDDVAHGSDDDDDDGSVEDVVLGEGSDDDDDDDVDSEDDDQLGEEDFDEEEGSDEEDSEEDEPTSRKGGRASKLELMDLEASESEGEEDLSGDEDEEDEESEEEE